MRQLVTSLHIGVLANPHRVQRAGVFALATMLLIGIPELSMAGGNAVNVATGTSWLGVQFAAVFKTARLIILGLSVLYAMWEGVKAFRGDSGAWMKMASGFLVAFIVFNPQWIIQTLFGTTMSTTLTQRGVD